MGGGLVTGSGSVTVNVDNIDFIQLSETVSFFDEKRKNSSFSSAEFSAKEIKMMYMALDRLSAAGEDQEVPIYYPEARLFNRLEDAITSNIEKNKKESIKDLKKAKFMDSEGYYYFERQGYQLEKVMRDAVSSNKRESELKNMLPEVTNLNLILNNKIARQALVVGF